MILLAKQNSSSTDIREGTKTAAFCLVCQSENSYYRNTSAIMARCPFVMLSVLLSICLSAQLNPVWSEEVQGGRRSVADIHIVNSFLSYVEIIQRNKDNCAPGVTFDLGERVVAQFGDEEFKQQAMLAVNRANFLTRIWKGSSQVLLDSEYFFYTQVRSMVEGDPDIFAAINCYDSMEYPDYRLFCPYAYRLPNDSSEIMVKDLAMEYKYDGSDAEFFSVPKVNARYKLSQVYKETIGKCYIRNHILY